MTQQTRTITFGDSPPPSLTYEPYFGLREKAFSLSSDPRFLYTGPSRQPAFDRLLAGIRRREGLIVLSGEIGTGKTTLCRAVLEALDRRTFSTFVRDPFLSREDLLKTLLIDFGVMSIDDLKSGRLANATRPDLSYPLYEFLDSLAPLQAFAVLIIDEAQNLSPDLLEEIRILSELEAREKLLQVVLVGQPELRAKLKLPQLRQLDQRVSVRCELAPLEAGEVAGYIAHRIGVASVGAPAVKFTPGAAHLVWRASGGLPRVVNLICDRALDHGFIARATEIDEALVAAALVDLGRTIEEEPSTGDARRAAGAASGQETPGASAMPAPDAGARDPRSRPGTPVLPPANVRTHAAETHERAGTRVVTRRPPPRRTDPLAEFSAERDFRPGRTPRAKGIAGWELLAAAALVGGLVYGLWAMSGDGASLSSPEAVPPPIVAPAPTDHDPAPAPEIVPTTAPDSGTPIARPLEASPPPANGTYAIQVASFQNRARARRLFAELAADGHRARELRVDLGERGIWWQVIVGGYDSVAAAAPDLASIRARPSYADARIVTADGADAP